MSNKELCMQMGTTFFSCFVLHLIPFFGKDGNAGRNLHHKLRLEWLERFSWSERKKEYLMYIRRDSTDSSHPDCMTLNGGYHHLCEENSQRSLSYCIPGASPVLLSLCLSPVFSSLLNPSCICHDGMPLQMQPWVTPHVPHSFKQQASMGLPGSYRNKNPILMLSMLRHSMSELHCLEFYSLKGCHWYEGSVSAADLNLACEGANRRSR